MYCIGIIQRPILVSLKQLRYEIIVLIALL